jgi:hypothetical protein
MGLKLGGMGGWRLRVRIIRIAANPTIAAEVMISFV